MTEEEERAAAYLRSLRSRRAAAKARAKRLAGNPARLAALKEKTEPLLTEGTLLDPRYRGGIHG